MLLQLLLEDSSESMIWQTSTGIEPFVFLQAMKKGKKDKRDTTRKHCNAGIARKENVMKQIKAQQRNDHHI